MKKIRLISLLLILSLCMTVVLAACVTPSEHICQHICPYCKKCMDQSCQDSSCSQKCTCEPVAVEHTQWKILADTLYETEVHKYTTNKEGPKIAIVGGIHGDEVAGWNAGLRLVTQLLKQKGIRGEILLIPQANILADNRTERYVGITTATNGVSTVNGVRYSDLNRSFPKDRYANATPTTIEISTAIVAAVENFGCQYVIDLHESRNSWTQQATSSYTLGDTLIFENDYFFMEELLAHYNATYKQADQPNFVSQPSSQEGSFNYYFTNTYPNATVFTIETNRQYVNGIGDTADLETRITQQLNIIQALFDLAWDMV